MKCNKCNYEWESRKENPKACPRCKSRLDLKQTIPSNLQQLKDTEYKGEDPKKGAD